MELKKFKIKNISLKNQYNNLIENGNIKYKLTDSKKTYHDRRWNCFFNSNGSTIC